MTNDPVQQRINAAMTSSDPVLVNEVACELAELTHFETLNHTFLNDTRSQETIRRHASAVVHLLHHQRELLRRAIPANQA